MVNKLVPKEGIKKFSPQERESIQKFITEYSQMAKLYIDNGFSQAQKPHVHQTLEEFKPKHDQLKKELAEGGFTTTIELTENEIKFNEFIDKFDDLATWYNKAVSANHPKI